MQPVASSPPHDFQHGLEHNSSHRSPCGPIVMAMIKLIVGLVLGLILEGSVAVATENLIQTVSGIVIG